MDFNEKSQFQFLYQGLTDKYPGIKSADGVTSNFQFMQTPLFANWTSGDDAQAYDIANSTSLDLGGFFVRGDGFANSYKDMIQSIAPNTGDSNQEYKDDIARLSKNNKLKQSIIDHARTQYAVYKAQSGEDAENFQEWLNDPFGGSNFQEQLNTLNIQMNDINKNMQSILDAIDKPLADAQGKVNPWSETMNIGRAEQSLLVPLVTISGDLQGDIKNWETYADGDYDFKMDPITGESVIKSPWRTTYKTTVEQKCLSTKVSTHVNTARIISDKHYKLEVMAVGAQSYLIERGTWYDETFLSPDTPIVEGSYFTNDSFFGLHGTLHLVPETIFVLYRPTIKLTISTKLFKQQFEENADLKIDWLDLFSFRFDFGGLASLQPEGDETTTTVTFQAPENQYAQIIGITSKVAYNGNKI